MLKLLTGDCRTLLSTLPAESIQCVVTSPPYFGLRDYQVAGQLGLESSPQAYVDELVAVFREVKRVLRPDGTCWLNIGDSYASNGISGLNQGWAERAAKQYRGGGHKAEPSRERGKKSVPAGLKPKDLMMIPARVALALQADGWWLRSEIVWAKSAPMPESVRDRPTCAHEKVFLLTKAANYYYDQDAVREPYAPDSVARVGRGRSDDHKYADGGPGGQTLAADISKACSSPIGANLRNVWHLNPEPFPGAHFATMPSTLAERCIKAGTSEKGQCPECGAPWVRVSISDSSLNDRNERIADYDVPGLAKGKAADRARRLDGKNYIHVRTPTNYWQPSCACPEHTPVPQTVLDPFAGAGTTPLVADRLQRHGIGIELNQEYAAMARQRLFNDAPLFAEVA